ncbi:MAG: hypothetical protein IJ636_08625 [Bacteroidales bacterium]|nr:hypothetical protein [Bacteroidales bacterium]
MKKIIYSLVIMIAAGSLFTSCIDQVEPVGILEMRTAKAEYIRALKDLRAADAEFRRAEAQLKLADARYRDAETAWMNAQTENQNLLNELQALLNEAQAMDNELKAAEIADKIARMQLQMEKDLKQHEIDMLKLEQALAQAEEDLRVALRNIALHSQDLTDDEKKAVAEAVGLYEAVYEVYLKQAVQVKKAQAYVDSLKEWKVRFADKGWDSDNHKYAYKVDLWQREIEKAQARIEKDKAKLDAVPNPDEIDMNEWNAELEALKAEQDALTYEFNTTTVKDIANYYVNNVHDGVKEFNDAIKVFEAQFDGYNLTPLTEAEKALIKAGEKTQDDFKKAMADSIAFPAFAKGDISVANFSKFAYLLKSYKQVSPYAVDGSEIMVFPAVDTIKIAGPVKQAMKDFILGAAGNGEGSQKYECTVNKVKKSIKANYGLWGAYDILERELVAAKDEAKTAEEIAELKKKMNEADSVWTAHRAILINGLAKYEPYTKAIAAYEKTVKDNGNGATAMVKAIDAVRTELNKVDGVADFVSFTQNDSVAIFNAFVAFATARENYLDYTYDKKKDAHDLNYFRYASGKSGGKVIVDSVKFSAMTWADFAAHKYDFAEDGTAPVSLTDVAATLPLDKEDGIVNIANALMGADFGAALAASPMATEGGTDLTTAKFNTSALYSGLYKVDDYVKPTKILNADDSEFTPSNLEKAKKAVLDAVDEYIKVYNSFWNGTVAKAGTEYDAYFTAVEGGKTAKEIANAKKAAEDAINALFTYDADDVKGYTLATFKPYADEAPIVTFTGDNVDGTDAINAILTAVDPACTDKTDNEYFENNAINTGAIFNGNATDFYKFMKAAYDYYMATNETISDDLAAIKAWIEDVEKTFENDAANTGKDDTDAFKAWQKAYKAATDHYADLAEYNVALAEFTGVDEDGYPNGIVKITGTYDDPASITPPATFELFDYNVLGDVTGWYKYLGGEQLALAEKLFPNFPDTWQTWKEEIEDYEDEKAHLDILMTSFKTAYFAAAQAAGYDQFSDAAKAATNWDELYNAYKAARKAYVDALKADITKQTENIDKAAQKIADYWSQVPAIDIEIADAEADLAIEQRRLAALEKALDYAKANMEKVMDYVQNQDANFVLLNLDGSELASIYSALSALGITIPQFSK